MSAAQDPTGLRLAERGLLVLLFAWLAIAALVVNVEPFDGLDSIAVARYFTGGAEVYAMNRAPLMGALLAPMDLLVRRLDLPPFELRPYHLVSATLHGLYLFACLRLVYRVTGRDWASFLAFAGCVPTFVFFSYSPFVSHDLAAGALLLAMVALAGDRPGPGRDAMLVALAAAAALLKHVFALFTIVLLVTAIGAAVVDRTRWREALRVVGISAAAGLLTYVALVLATGPTFAARDGTPALLAPLAQLDLLRAQPGTGPWWLYLRDALAYGALTAALLVPGAWLTLRHGSEATRRTVVVAGLLGALLLALPNREVRYLAILSPLAAVIVTPAVRALLARRTGQVLIAACLLWGLVPGTPYSVTGEAARIARPFYGAHPARALLAPLEAAPPARLFSGVPMLSFAPEGLRPMAADRFHRWFHVSPYHIEVLYGLAPGAVDRLRGSDSAPIVRWHPDAMLLVASGAPLTNPQSWTGGTAPRARGYQHELAAARAAAGAAWELPGGEIALDTRRSPTLGRLHLPHVVTPGGAIVAVRVAETARREGAARDAAGLDVRGYESVTIVPALSR